MRQLIRTALFASCAALAGCTGSNGGLQLSVESPLHFDAGQLAIDGASATRAGALSASDWSTFNGKVSSVTAGTGLQASGTAQAPQLSVAYGTTAGTAAAGDDPRFSDPRSPTSGDGAYIQNGTAPQTADLNITGAAITGSLVTSNLQATYLAVGTGTPPVADEAPGTLFILGATVWGLEADAAPALQIIDRTSNVRRAIFNTSGDVFMGDTISCTGGCSAGFGYQAADKTFTTAGPIGTTNGRVQHDAAFFDSNGTSDTTPVHIKTTITVPGALAFRFALEGYNWGVDDEVDSVCVGVFGAGGITGKGCTDRSSGVAAGVYVSSDGFLTVRATSASIAHAGFKLSVSYFSPVAQQAALRIDYQVIRSATDL